MKFIFIKAIFHCSRFAHAGGATDFNLVKNQSREHAKKVKCSSTSKRVRAYKSRQKTLRLDTNSKGSNMFAPHTAMENGLLGLNHCNFD